MHKLGTSVLFSVDFCVLLKTRFFDDKGVDCYHALFSILTLEGLSALIAINNWTFKGYANETDL
jgi:hypothetical protein